MQDIACDIGIIRAYRWKAMHRKKALAFARYLVENSLRFSLSWTHGGLWSHGILPSDFDGRWMG